jgi:hypothetical protein
LSGGGLSPAVAAVPQVRGEGFGGKDRRCPETEEVGAAGRNGGVVGPWDEDARGRRRCGVVVR